MNAQTPTRGAEKRRYPTTLRLRFLRLLFCGSRKRSFTRRLILLSRRYGVSQRQAWRWVALYRKAGVDGLRDHVRRDTLTRRAPANVRSITPGGPVRFPLDTTTSRATKVPS